MRFVLGGGIAGILLWLACAVGWIANIFQVIGLAGGGPVTTMFILKVVGIFAFPLGIVLGWVGIFS